MMREMEKENVLIGRPFPPFYEWARISTGTMEDMKLFDKGLRKVMRS
jgi:histidinol-phosphate aminotransferase